MAKKPKASFEVGTVYRVDSIFLTKDGTIKVKVLTHPRGHRTLTFGRTAGGKDRFPAALLGSFLDKVDGQLSGGFPAVTVEVERL